MYNSVTREVLFGNPSGAEENQAEWFVQNRSQTGDRAMVSAASLGAVWLKSVSSQGYLSNRENEGILNFPILPNSPSIIRLDL